MGQCANCRMRDFDRGLQGKTDPAVPNLDSGHDKPGRVLLSRTMVVWRDRLGTKQSENRVGNWCDLSNDLFARLFARAGSKLFYSVPFCAIYRST